MHFILIILICITSDMLTLAMIPDFKMHARYEYLSTNKQWPELKEDVVMDDFWKAVRDYCSQEKKNQALLEILARPAEDNHYPIQREDIAAAIFAGADVRTVQELSLNMYCFKLVPDATINNDLPLLTLLLAPNNNAYVYENDKYGCEGPPIFRARTIASAQLLIEHNALLYLNKEQKEDLFTRAMWENRDPGLISLYKKHNLDPMTRSNRGYTLLMMLALDPYQDLVKKAKLLFENMSHEKICELITTKNLDGQTIFDIIKHKKRCGSQRAYCALNAFHSLLLQKKQHDECPICLEEFGDNIAEKTSCNHVFHQYCLRTWTKNNHDCPICRTDI